MALDLHIQTMVDRRTLATIAQAYTAGGIRVTSIASLVREVLEQTALDLVNGGADGFRFSEEATQALTDMGLMKSGFQDKTRSRYLHNVSDQNNYVSAKLREQQGQKQEVISQEQLLKEEQLNKREPTEYMKKSFAAALKGMSSSDQAALREELERRNLAPIASTNIEGEEVGDNEASESVRDARRQREEQEMLQLLKMNPANLPIATSTQGVKDAKSSEEA